MQILDPEFEVRLVVLPRHTIHAGDGFALKRVERRPERIDTDMVEEAVNFSFFLCLAARRTRPSAWVTRARLCARCVLC
jgi:hypothetical protein